MPTISTGAAGVPISYKLPGVYLQVVFGASPSGAGGGPRKVLLLGNKTAAGSATADTEKVQLFSPADAVTYHGEGSELALMAAAAFLKAPAATIEAIAVTEASGTKASGTITVVNSATGSGTARFYVHGVECAVAVYSGDVIATIAANIAAAINAQSAKLNATASAALGVVTITARHNGTRGNLIKLRKSIDASITATTFTLSGATLSGGSGTDTLTAALTTAATARDHYYAVASVDTTALQAVQTQLDTMAGPLVGKRQQAVYASHDVLGTATTQAEALNEERFQGLWAPKYETLPCVIAAAWAAMRSVEEGVSVSVNLSSFNPSAVDLWPAVLPPPSEGDWLTNSQANSALDVGLTPLMVREGDKHPFIPLSITTHSNDASGNPDTRTLTTNYVTVPDAFADEFAVWLPTTFVAMKLAEDVESGDDPLPPLTTTPGTVQAMWFDVARRQFENAGHIVDLDDDGAQWAFSIAPGNPNRLNATMPITPSAWFTQMSAQVRQLTPGA